MDRDLLAAAAAAGAEVPCDVEMHPVHDMHLGRVMPGAAVAADAYDNLTYEDPAIFEFPNVDDLEVAAAAAAAALEVLAPAPKKWHEFDSSDDDSDDSDEESSDEESSDDSDSDSDDSDDSDEESSSSSMRAGGQAVASPALHRAAAATITAASPLSVRFEVSPEATATGDRTVHLRLMYGTHTPARAGPSSASAAEAAATEAGLGGDDGSGRGDLTMREVETDSDPLNSSSSEDEDDVAAAAAAAANPMMDEEGLQTLDHEGMRDLITRAYADDEDEEGGGGGAGGGGTRSALEDLGLPAAPPDLSGVEVKAEDVMAPAGSCLSVCEGMVVMQGLANSRPLAEGSVIVAEDRTPLGSVEEVFGPVMQPLYAFRYSVKGPLPPCVKPGAALFVVPRMSRQLTAEEIFGSGTKVAEPEVASDEEVYFSDDEVEQHYLRQQVAKRKGAPDGAMVEGAAAAVGGRPRQRSRAAAAATNAKGPGTAFQVDATAGAMSAMLGLGGDDRGGRHGGGRGGVRHSGGRGGAGRHPHSSHQHQHQGGRGRGSAAPSSGNGGNVEGKWMRPVRDYDTAQGQRPPPQQQQQHPYHHPPTQPYYGSSGPQPPPPSYHPHPSPPYNGPQGPPLGSGGPPYQGPPSYGPPPPPQPTGYGAGYAQPPPPSYGPHGQSSYHYSHPPGGSMSPSHPSSHPPYHHASAPGPLGNAGPPPSAGYFPPRPYGNGPPPSQPQQHQHSYHHDRQQQQYPGGEPGGGHPQYFGQPAPAPAQYGAGGQPPPGQSWW